MDFRPLEGKERTALLEALRKNASDGAELRMSPRDTSFLPDGPDEETERTISAIQSVPTHYADGKEELILEASGTSITGFTNGNFTVVNETGMDLRLLVETKDGVPTLRVQMVAKWHVDGKYYRIGPAQTIATVATASDEEITKATARFEEKYGACAHSADVEPNPNWHEEMLAEMLKAGRKTLGLQPGEKKRLNILNGPPKESDEWIIPPEVDEAAKHHFATELSEHGITPEFVDHITKQAFDWYKQQMAQVATPAGSALRCPKCGKFQERDEAFFPVRWQGSDVYLCGACKDTVPELPKEVKK